MAGNVNLLAYSDALLVLGTAGIVVPVVRKFGLNPVLGYLGAGVILGPLGLGSLKEWVPAIQWVTISDAASIEGIASLGVVFLLFLIGLELSFERLMTMRRLVFGLGGLQVVLTTILISGLASLFEVRPSIAVLIGACFALSSTAIVIELLSNQNRLATVTGRSTFSVLLAQDLAVVPLLMYISTIGDHGDLTTKLGIAGLKATIAVIVIAILGRLALRPLFRLVAQTRSNELFIAATLFVVVGTGVVAAAAGLSMALGAFVAGLLLAETEYRKAIETAIEPFKGLLLGIFFFTIGTHIDLRTIVEHPVAVFGTVAGLIVIKAVLFIGLARLFGLSWPTAIEAGILLGPAGEFALVGIELASSLALIRLDVASFVYVVTAISMALLPPLAYLARRIHLSMVPPKPINPAALVPPVPATGHAIVIGQGRVGRVVTSLLVDNKCNYLAVEGDPELVADRREQGFEVYFGNATDPLFLEACGLADARLVIITIHNQAAIDRIVSEVRARRPELPIVVRAKDRAHARHLYAIGATDAVPETLEASLQLSEASLLAFGVAAGPAIASIHEKRDEFRRDLQQAASSATGTGLASSRAYGLRAKTGSAKP